MNVLMIGATGSNAGLVLPELKSRGVTVRALVRDSDKAAAVRDRGADETVLGDLTDPESLRAAAKGMDGVFHINPAFAPQEADLGVAMVHAAQSQGVRKFVFSGVMHPTLATLVNHADKAPVEQALYTSGMDYTILQPAMFMQMLDGAWASARDQGIISMPYSKRARMCYVDYRDVAETAAVAMTGELLSNGTFELCSPGTFDRTDLADLMARALGRPVQADESSPAEAARQLPAGPMREGMTRMTDHYDQHGFRGGNALVLRAALGREPTTVAQYIESSPPAPSRTPPGPAEAARHEPPAARPPQGTSARLSLRGRPATDEPTVRSPQRDQDKPAPGASTHPLDRSPTCH